MNDKQIDLLLSQTFERNDMLQGMERRVMKRLKRKRRLRVAKQWLKVLTFCFGLPIIMLFGVWGLITLSRGADDLAFKIPVIASAVIFASALIVTTNRSLKKFSFRDV